MTEHRSEQSYLWIIDCCPTDMYRGCGLHFKNLNNVQTVMLIIIVDTALASSLFSQSYNLL